MFEFITDFTLVLFRLFMSLVFVYCSMLIIMNIKDKWQETIKKHKGVQKNNGKNS